MAAKGVGVMTHVGASQMGLSGVISSEKPQRETEWSEAGREEFMGFLVNPSILHAGSTPPLHRG